MLDQDFYQFLEYGICQAFNNSPDEEIKGFWCDGVMPSAANPGLIGRKIELKAFIGKDGQSAYELILKLGNKALSRYSRQLDLKECIPDTDNPNWFYIDTKKRTMEIQLD
ncbi:hypothetical protein F0L74_24545 [Chitinophaga agrisoli]|uniref:Uncharacterized protein n=1 Tax=Chitinophaga agrisoli TaxID=2607653 RepID=A0A5B2VKN0_9BACT|nr:hypothetical protein [Chitinophaga agrisoli]KAA2239374.1 hypothetical protein F0L74_24545 [Chitinophaga agrisoli]